MNKKPTMTDGKLLTSAVARYRVQLCHDTPLLDADLRSGKMQRCCFSSLIEPYKLILFDAYGVLNRGEGGIEGAVEAVDLCRQHETPFLVVSNNASERPQGVWQKLQKLGFEIHLDQIITSGMAVKSFVANSPFRSQPYLLIGTPDSASDYAPNPDNLLINPPGAPLKTDKKPSYVLICSNRDYYGKAQQQVVESWLDKAPLPLLVANPDMVVQSQQGEPVVVAGYTADELARRFGSEIIGIGKPFSPVYQLVMARFPHLLSQEILMVGDSLTTDILGGCAMGFATCLTLSGIHAQEAEQMESLCCDWAIQPDYIVNSIGGIYKDSRPNGYSQLKPNLDNDNG
ncbi:MAG: HAD-IIA family hydrolase [Magnetococcales bacterium]|nr:HAD-IIA family hydrolase [Magnetococcales bacterium]